jgi:hypothetical protein
MRSKPSTGMVRGAAVGSQPGALPAVIHFIRVDTIPSLERSLDRPLAGSLAPAGIIRNLVIP